MNFWNEFVHQQGVSINRILLYIKINRYRSYTIFTDALCLVTRYCCENTTKYIVAMTILFKLSILYLCFAPHGRKNISVYPKLTRYDEIYHTQIDWEHPHFWCILLLIYACLISKKFGFQKLKILRSKPGWYRSTLKIKLIFFKLPDVD